MKIGVIGANGYIGSEIVDSLASMKIHEVCSITRNENGAKNAPELDLVIHAANPARRFQANQAPEVDYIETVIKTITLLEHYEGVPFLLISSISCRTQLDAAYGYNRHTCEQLVLAKQGVVVRLGPLFGGNRTSDTVHDLVQNKRIYLSPVTKYAYADVKWVANYISWNAPDFSGVVELGARNTVTIGEIAAAINSSSVIDGPIDDQFPANFPMGPDAKDVIRYALNLKR
jgi:nucleoside-diphosphate-sugar epimerase